MAHEQQSSKEKSRLSSCEAYWETIQSRKKLPYSLQETLTSAFARIPVSSFPQVPGGKVIEIQADVSVADAVKILSESNILSAPVKNPDAGSARDWRDRYLGIIDYAAIILWVMESAELAAVALSASSATAAGVGAGAVGALGAIVLGATGPAAVAGLTVAAVGAAVVGSVAAEKGMGKDAPTAVIEPGKPDIKNFITQSAIVQGLEGCRGRDWFDCIASRPLSDLGLPFMSADQVVTIQSHDLILEAFKRMKDNHIGGLPVVEGPNNKIVGNISIRDIRHLLLKPELFSSFRQLSVMDFMNVVTQIQESGRVMPPITCTRDSTLGSVIHCLASKSVHRIYVTAGNEDAVVGIITLRDVISCFIHEPPNHFDDYFGFSVKEMLNQ